MKTRGRHEVRAELTLYQAAKGTNILDDMHEVPTRVNKNWLLDDARSHPHMGASFVRC